MSHSVLIEGFVDEDQAKAFISWYEGQGEQDIGYWMEATGTPVPYVSCSKTYPLVTEGNVTKMFIEGE
jgi:hypothetical protein